MATPHINAQKEDIAKIVLTSGDPKRCEYIATKYLNNTKIVNTVRGMIAYTGYYDNTKVTIFPVGMGLASMGLYIYELFKFYDVEYVIRIGTCGTTSDYVNILDTVLLESSYTESNYAYSLKRDDKTHIAYASPQLNALIKLSAKEKNIDLICGDGLCNEVFDVYLSDDEFNDVLNNVPSSLNLVATEMEAFALFYIAKLFNRKASCLLSVVDSKKNKISISSEEREKSLNNMIEVALETAKKIN